LIAHELTEAPEAARCGVKNQPRQFPDFRLVLFLAGVRLPWTIEPVRDIAKSFGSIRKARRSKVFASRTTSCSPPSAKN